MTHSLKQILVQASSRSWSGGRDLCVNPLDGVPVILRTIERLAEAFPTVGLTIIAPEFDRGGELDAIVKNGAYQINVYYGDDASPLNRMVNVTVGLREEDLVLRVDGLNFCVDIQAAASMVKMATTSGADCVKLPDDFPVQFTSDVYRVSALRKAAACIGDSEDAFKVHPKYFMFREKGLFHCARLLDVARYDDSYLQQCREQAESIYAEPRQEVNKNKIKVGDQLTFHYELASEYVGSGDYVLDIACGEGYGSRLLAKCAEKVIGADIDNGSIKIAEEKSVGLKNLTFFRQDVTKTTFEDHAFDVVVSMETIEHVPEEPYFNEIKRILKRNGIFILSTPQNSLGHIPINAAHLREYSLDGLISACRQYFSVEKVIGLKQGRIIIDGDPIGTNAMVVCRNTV